MENSLDYSHPVAKRRPLSSGFQASPARRRGQDRADRPRSWVYNLVRPSREMVETWLDSCDDPSNPLWCYLLKGASDVATLNSSLPSLISEPEHLTVDVNFWFFLIYYGIYVTVTLVYITQIVSLYRLNWWPAALGATSYTFFWIGSLVAGWVLHELDPFGTEGVCC
ncbi:hypothetical protein ACQY0O_004906 [Thecaphora frezii]